MRKCFLFLISAIAALTFACHGDKGVSVTGVYLGKPDLTLNVGETASLTATVWPMNAANRNVTWQSSDEAIATVSDTGLVTAVSIGQAAITATSVQGGFKDTCAVTVVTPVTGVSLDRKALTLEVGGPSEILTAAISPEVGSRREVEWSSSNTGVATVSMGVVTAMGNGSAVITVRTIDGGFEDTCTVTVITRVTGVALSPGRLMLDPDSAPVALTATITPPSATNQGVTWSSSNNQVAAVSNYGIVTVAGNGIAAITVRTVDGGFTASCVVNVSSVYVAGYENIGGQTIATLWKHDGDTTTPIRLNQSDFALAYSVHVSGGIAYVAGCESIGGQNVATLWKHDGNTTTPIRLEPSNNSEAYSVHVSGGVAYAAGYESIGGQSIATLWKYGGNTATPIRLNQSNHAAANSIYVSGGVVYAAGYELSGSAVATLWKHDGNTTTPIRLEPSNNPEAYSVCASVYVSGGVAYAAGHENIGGQDMVMFWKYNGNTTTPIRLEPGNRAQAYSVYVSGDVVYAAGYENIDDADIATLWKHDGDAATPIRLNQGGFAWANSVYVSGGVAYAAGYENIGSQDIATLWKHDGNTTTPIRLNQSDYARAMSVFVASPE